MVVVALHEAVATLQVDRCGGSGCGGDGGVVVCVYVWVWGCGKLRAGQRRVWRW